MVGRCKDCVYGFSLDDGEWKGRGFLRCEIATLPSSLMQPVNYDYNDHRLVEPTTGDTLAPIVLVHDMFGCIQFEDDKE